MLNVFFGTECAIRREFVPEGQKINAEFYVGVFGAATEDNSTS
jgi:hypothetical protein